MRRSVKLHAHGVAAPAPFTPAQVQAGFAEYDTDCSACHGAPGIGRQAWVNGMTPSPPYLTGASRDWTAPELFWIVRNGVKMTAMPAWTYQRTDRQIWDVVAFLEAMPSIDARAYARMRAARLAGTPPTAE
ncbi:MAG: cytochrome c [Caulobacteraceae bacterium]